MVNLWGWPSEVLKAHCFTQVWRVSLDKWSALHYRNKEGCLLCWPTISEVDIGGTAVEVEPSQQYPITFCCCVTDGSREAVWQNGIWYGRAYEAEVRRWIPSWGNNCIHWHSLIFAEHFWRPNSGVSAHWGSGWCISEVETEAVGHLHWCRFLRVWHESSFLMVKMHS